MDLIPCDLHIHSQNSDGRYKVRRLVRYLAGRRIRLTALTDHDTMSGFPEFFEQAQEKGIRVISGIELTSWLEVNREGEEVHLLGYGLKWSGSLVEELEELKADRDAHQKRIMERLAVLGFPLSYEAVLRRAGENPIIVSHLIWEWILNHKSVAVYLLLTGRLRQWISNFLKLTGPGGDAYLPPPMRFEDAIRFIRRHEGVCVVAHPVKIKNSRIRTEALSADIDGIEVFYPAQEKIEDELVSIAKKRGLVVTGGSDWHGYFAGAYPGWNLPLSLVNALLLRLGLPPIKG